jgi:hypothetical protein
MKNVLASVVVSVLFFCTAHTQDPNNEWTYKISYLTTDDCVDSVTCYTEIVINLNMVIVPDSTLMNFKIGSTFGAGDIYDASYYRTPALPELPEVSIDSLGNANISLGKYIVGDDYYVDVSFH